MTKRWGIVMLLVLMTAALQAGDTISCQWRGLPLHQVLHEIERMSGYTLLYNQDELPVNQLVTVTYTSASVRDVLTNILKGYKLSYRGCVVSISPALQHRYSGEQRVRVTRDSVRAYTDTLVQRNKDTVVTYSSHMEKQSHEEYRDTVRPGSHRVIAGIGAGYSTLNTSRLRLADNYAWMQEMAKSTGFVGGQADVSYAFFWNDHWGVSLGLGADYYSQRYTANGTHVEKGYVDTDHEIKAELKTEAKNVTEMQRAVMVNIPLMLQMEYKWVYAAAGARLGAPVYHRYAASGDLTTSGYYEKWDLLLDNMHEYRLRDEQYQGDIAMSPVALAAQAELGVAIPVANSLSPVAITIGAYGNIQTLKRYDVQPWQVGLKIGVRWQHARRAKHNINTTWSTLERVDTVYTLTERVDTTYRIWTDTLRLEQEVTIAVIWFEFDKYHIMPDAETLLDQWAKQLRNNREMRVNIVGHTCVIGSDEVNERLSRNRANAVYEALLKRGVSAEQMVVGAVASEQPYNSATHAFYLDRRVEIVPVIGYR